MVHNFRTEKSKTFVFINFRAVIFAKLLPQGNKLFPQRAVRRGGGDL